MDRQTYPTTKVAEAKQKLRTASAGIDYLAPVKHYPLAMAGAAFFAGVLFNRLGKNHLPPGLLPLALQLLKRL